MGYSSEHDCRAHVYSLHTVTRNLNVNSFLVLISLLTIKSFASLTNRHACVKPASRQRHIKRFLFTHTCPVILRYDKQCSSDKPSLCEPCLTGLLLCAVTIGGGDPLLAHSRRCFLNRQRSQKCVCCWGNLYGLQWHYNRITPVKLMLLVCVWGVCVNKWIYSLTWVNPQEGSYILSLK